MGPSALQDEVSWHSQTRGGVCKPKSPAQGSTLGDVAGPAPPPSGSSPGFTSLDVVWLEQLLFWMSAVAMPWG